MKTLAELHDLSGRCVIVTGAAGAIGLKVAETIAELGAHVIITDRPSSDLATVATHLAGHWPHSRIQVLACELEDEQSRIEFAASVHQQHKSVHCLIHCAAFVGTSDLEGWVDTFENQSLSTWRRAFEVNLTSAFHLSQLFAASLSEAQGNLIFFSSIYGVLAPDYSLYESTEMGNPAAYAASKGGLVQLTRWLASTLAPCVRVNCISPGGVARGQDEKFVSRYEQKTPLARMANEDDFKGIVALLASDAGRYMTGQNIMVDGGWSSW